jgi:hypothetical protein
VAQLVDERFANRDHDLILVAVALVLDLPLKQRDPVRQRVAVSPLPLRKRDTLVEPQQRVLRIDLHLGQERG